MTRKGRRWNCDTRAASGGVIALIEEGDQIAFDIPGRSIELKVDEATLDERRQAMKAFKHPAPRRRRVSKALRAYAIFASSADRGGIRDLGDAEDE